MNKALVAAFLAALLFHAVLLFVILPGQRVSVISVADGRQVRVSMGSLRLVSEKVAPVKKIVGREMVESEAKGEQTNEYLAGIRRKIELAKSFPDAARSQGIEGTAQVEFVVLVDGRAGGIKLAQSSKNQILDDEALTTIKRAAPFAPIPASFKSSQITLRIPIVFELK